MLVRFSRVRAGDHYMALVTFHLLTTPGLLTIKLAPVQIQQKLPWADHNDLIIGLTLFPLLAEEINWEFRQLTAYLMLSLCLLLGKNSWLELEDSDQALPVTSYNKRDNGWAEAAGKPPDLSRSWRSSHAETDHKPHTRRAETKASQILGASQIRPSRCEKYAPSC